MAKFLGLAYVWYRQWFLNQGQHIKACKLAFTLDLSMCNSPTHWPIGTCLWTYYYLVTICKQKTTDRAQSGSSHHNKAFLGAGESECMSLAWISNMTVSHFEE